MKYQGKALRLGAFAAIVSFAVLLATSASGCAKTAANDSGSVAVASKSLADGHVVGDGLTRGPRKTDGAEEITLAAAEKRARFSLRLPDPAETLDDSTVVRVLPQGSDAGEGFYVQYKKYEVALMPTNVLFDPNQYTEQKKYLRDLSDPSSEFVRYRPAQVGSYDGVIGAEFTQMDGSSPVANAPAIVAWQVPAPVGADAKYLNITISAWGVPETKLLRIAQSLNRKTN